MEIVVPLAVRDEGEQRVVAAGVAFRVGAGSVEVRHGIDQEGRVVDQCDTEKPAPEKSPERAAEESADQSRNPQAHDEADRTVETELPPDKAVRPKVGDIVVRALGRLRVEQPEDVRPEPAPAGCCTGPSPDPRIGDGRGGRRTA